MSIMPMEDRVFKYALIFSVFLHAVALLQISRINNQNRPRPINRIEVVYQEIKHAPPQEKMRPPQSMKAIQSIQERRLPKDAEVLLRDPSPLLPPVQDMQKSSVEKKFQMDRKLASRLEGVGVKRKISVPEIKSEKINNPTYLNYYHIVRNKIQDRAYRNYAQMDVGEVYLTFVLLSSGALKQIQLIDEKTSATDYLRSIGLKSIREASPFPSFPQDLKYPELSFNVVISFEANK